MIAPKITNNKPYTTSKSGIMKFSFSTAQIIFLGYLALLLGIIVMKNANIGLSIFQFMNDIAHLDKVGHFILFGLLSFTLTFALKHKSVKLKGITLPVGAAIIMSATIIEECSQIYIASRTFSFFDMLANITGVICFSVLAHSMPLRKSQEIR